MAVTQQNTVFSYIASGVSSFDFGFRLLALGDLVVTVNGVKQSTSAYSVTGIGAVNGGTVTFTTAPVAGSLVKLIRQTQAIRSTDYQTGGDFRSDVVNPDFDRVYMLAQDFLGGSVDILNAIRAPAGENLPSLPSAAARANYLLGFDGSGNPSAIAPAAQSASALALVLAGPNGPASIGIQLSAVGAVVQSLQDFLRAGVAFNVKSFGAVGNGIADDTLAVTAADSAAYLAGVNLYFPAGSYKLTSVISKQPNVQWFGTGRRKTYPGVFSPGTNTLSTIFATHTGRCLFKVSSNVADSAGNLVFRDLNFATLGIAGSLGPTSCVGFECGDGLFQRDFTFERCGIHGFTSAFDSYKIGAGAAIEMGVLKVFNCTINLNGWIARNLDGTQWNGFTFQHNEAGQNGYNTGLGGIDIAAYSANVDFNILEGQRDAVKIRGSYRGISVRGNYFENNVGTACIQLKDVRGPWTIGPNNYSGVNFGLLDHLVFLGTSCGQGQCLDPYWPELVHKTPIAVLGADAGVGDNILNPNPSYQFARVDRVVGQVFSQLPANLSMVTQPVTISQRDINPQTGMPMPIQEYTTSGVGALSLPYTIAGSSGQWVVVCWLMKQISGSGDPYLSLNVNGNTSGGSRDVPISRFGTYWLMGEWALITCATKLSSTMTSLTLNVYPHGVSAPAGYLSRFLRPLVYVTDSPTKILPYLDNVTAQSCNPAPAAGTWNKGDLLINSFPGAANQGQFSCITAGTPGTWVYT